MYKCIGFYVHRRSYLIWFPGIVSFFTLFGAAPTVLGNFTLILVWNMDFAIVEGLRINEQKKMTLRDIKKC